MDSNKNRLKLFIFMTFFLLSPFSYSLSQTFRVPKSPLLDTVYNSPYPISVISNLNETPYFPFHLNNQNWKQILIKNENGLYILINGTGQVYKAIAQTDKQIIFQRKDSTFFMGHNFYAINFSWNRDLYSLGGYGFWRVNGALREFQEGREWSVVRLNKEFPSSNDYYCFLPDESILYYLRCYSNEISNEAQEKIAVIELNLKTHTNTVLGYPAFPELAKNPNFIINTPSLKGVLVAINGDIYLHQFPYNRCFRLTNDKIKNMLWGGGSQGTQNTFEMNGKIYFTRDNQDKVYSVSIQLNDFQLLEVPVYIRDSNQVKLYLWIIPLVILLSGTIIWWRKKIQNGMRTKDTMVLLEDDHSIAFSEMEKELIELIIGLSKHGKGATVEEINRKMGLSRKSLEIQKKFRSEIINRINHKFKVNYNHEQELIQRIRSLEDRRFFIYLIPNKLEEIYKNHPFAQFGGN